MKKCMSIIILFFSLSCLFARVLPDSEIKNIEIRYKDGKETYYTKYIDKLDFDKIIKICNESKYDNSGIMKKMPIPDYYITINYIDDTFISILIWDNLEQIKINEDWYFLGSNKIEFYNIISKYNQPTPPRSGRGMVVVVRYLSQGTYPLLRPRGAG